jgi:regulator of sigma E protease
LEKHDSARKDGVPASAGDSIATGRPETTETTKQAASSTAERVSAGGWLGRNGPYLVLIAALFIFLYMKFDLDDIWAMAKAALGLGLVIFIHELGHFLVAKWCDVHVQTFSIGFGPALPGCSFQWGETRYMIALFPLGGYVKMVGEGVESDESDEDPRSFKNKPVWQRMAIISAGVTMNLILAFICFVFVFRTHGDEQAPGVVGRVEPGSPAWKKGVRAGYVIEWIGSKGPNPSFDALMPEVMNSREGKPLKFVAGPPDNERLIDTEIYPQKDENAGRPMIGVAPPGQLQLLPANRAKGQGPVAYQSAAAAAEPPLAFDDDIIATTDPDHPDQVKALPPDPRMPQQLDYFEFENRLHRLAGRKMIVRVRRTKDGKTEEVDIHVPAAYHYVLGTRMRMGKITAVRDHSPAAVAGVQPNDIIDQVEVTTSAGSKIRLVNAPDKQVAGKDVSWVDLDTERLPSYLEQWAKDKNGDKEVTVTVLRTNPPPDGPRAGNHQELRKVPLKLKWDDSWEFAKEEPFTRGSPLSIPELGLAYKVETTVEAVKEGSPATTARVLKAADITFKKGDVIRDAQGSLRDGFKEGDVVHLEKDDTINLREGDVVKACRFYSAGKKKDDAGKPTDWIDLEPDDWASVFNSLQGADVKQLDVRLERDKLELSLTPQLLDGRTADPWPIDDRGLFLMADRRLVKANSLAQALSMGVIKTTGFIEQIFGNLRGIVTQRLGVKNFGGPIMIAQVAYHIAGEDIYKFIIFLGIIGVNLAVINFMPIPVLDGGHMVFLIYEKLRGKPAADWVRVGATYFGLALIICLMVAVIILDLRRL